MSIDDCLHCASNGFEIASHGDLHKNDIYDVRESLVKLKKWGLYADNDPIGFASPNSDIYEKDLRGFDKLIESGELLYIRTGTVVRRESYLYAFLYILNNIIRSKRLFWVLNKNNIISPNKNSYLLKSIAIKHNTPLKSIKYLINKAEENSIIVLLFHSILEKTSEYCKNEVWWYDITKSKDLCLWLMQNNNISIKTMRDSFIKK